LPPSHPARRAVLSIGNSGRLPEYAPKNSRQEVQLGCRQGPEDGLKKIHRTPSVSRQPKGPTTHQRLDCGSPLPLLFLRLQQLRRCHFTSPAHILSPSRARSPRLISARSTSDRFCSSCAWRSALFPAHDSDGKFRLGRASGAMQIFAGYFSHRHACAALMAVSRFSFPRGCIRAEINCSYGCSRPPPRRCRSWSHAPALKTRTARSEWASRSRQCQNSRRMPRPSSP